jgi:serine/threonine-protein kinase
MGPVRRIGRYELHDEIASGGMGSVHMGRLRGEEGGFARVVAIKALHAHYAKEESFRAMFLDEARLVSRIRHRNVVATLDVLQAAGDLFLVMEYVHGETLSRLLRAARDQASTEAVPISIACAIMSDVLEGLHAAHDATNEGGEPLFIVHRDVSPQNVIVGADGVALVADFGVAKAVGRLAEKFSEGESAKGKAGYMAPEQMRGARIDRRADVYAAGVVLWEVLTGRKLFTGESFAEIVTKALDGDVLAPSALRSEIPPALDAVALRALAREPKDRFATAHEMALAMDRACARATVRDVGAWVERVAHGALARRREQIASVENARPAAVADGDAREPPASQRTVVESAMTHTTTQAHVVKRAPRIAPFAGAFAVVALVGAVFLARPRAPAPAVAPELAPAPVPEPATSTAAATTPAPVPVPANAPVPAIATGTASMPTSNAHRLRPSAPAPIARPAPPPRESASPAASAPCHWEQLPDAEGILHPKKVCP